MHTLLDLHGNIPAFIDVTPAKIHEIHILDELVPEPGSIYIVERAYLDFERLYRLQQALAFFLIRPRKDFTFRRVGSHPVDKNTGLLCDQTIRLQGFCPAKFYPEPLRRIRYHDADTDKSLSFLTNNVVVAPGAVEAETVVILVEAGGCGHILEGGISFVVEEEVRRAVPRVVVGKREVVLLDPLIVIIQTEVNIQAPVAIVIAEGCAGEGSLRRLRESKRVGLQTELPIPLIEKEQRSAGGDDDQILIAIVADVREKRARSWSRNASQPSDGWEEEIARWSFRAAAPRISRSSSGFGEAAANCGERSPAIMRTFFGLLRSSMPHCVS